MKIRLFRYIYTYSHTLDQKPHWLFLFKEALFFFGKGPNLNFPVQWQQDYNSYILLILMHFTFADTLVNLLFRPEGSLVEQNLTNGESY